MYVSAHAATRGRSNLPVHECALDPSSTQPEGVRASRPPSREFAHWGCEEWTGVVGRTSTATPAFPPQHPNTKNHNPPRSLSALDPLPLSLSLSSSPRLKGRVKPPPSLSLSLCLSVSLCLSLCLAISLSIYLPISLLSVYLSMYLSI